MILLNSLLDVSMINYIHECMHDYRFISMHVCMVRVYKFKYDCMYVCMYVCMVICLCGYASKNV